MPSPEPMPKPKIKLGSMGVMFFRSRWSPVHLVRPATPMDTLCGKKVAGLRKYAWNPHMLPGTLCTECFSQE